MFLDCDAKVRQFPELAKYFGKKYVFSRFFLKIIAFSEIITQNAISTLQYDRLNSGYCVII
nr:MAG TPA: hypothetical protein [Caudoviricetes sp.]